MKFSCTQQVLAKALNTVSKAVTSRTTIPILKGILLEAGTDGKLKLAASDLDLSIEKTISVSVVEEGSVVVSAKLFSDIVRKLPSEEIEIEEENGNVTIRCLSSEFNIVGQAADEFPHIGVIKEEKKIQMEKDLLRDMIRKTSFSASIEESKGIIVGVLIEMEEESLTMVALDGFRMAVAKELVKNQEKKRIIISARILNEISKILSEDEEQKEADLILDDKKAVFILNETRVVSRLLEGEFIKYRDVLPKEYKCRLKVQKGELSDSIDRASLMAREGKSNLIRLNISGNKITITSRSEEGKVKEEVFVEKEGTDLEIGFNAKYISDVLKVVEDEEIYMEFNTGVSPCLIKPVEGDRFEYLVLPVRISAN